MTSGGIRRPWSLTRRLTVWYAAAALAVLALAASVLYWGLARSLRSEDDRFVLAKARELRTIATRYRDQPDMLREEIAIESAMPTLQGYAARILSPTGAVEAESPGMERDLPPARFPEPGLPRPVEWRSPSGHTYELFGAALTPEGGRTVQVALDVSRDAEVLDVQLALLAMVVVLGTLVSGAAGWLVARRGLRPLGRITATARTVSAARLDRRLGIRTWPAELADLARVFDGMLDRLEEAFARLSGFSADIAHELRTPLTNLRGAAEVALRRARSPEEYREVLESALEEYERLTDMIDRLLFLARADTGAAALERRPLDLRAEIDATCEYFAPLAEEAGVTLACSGSATAGADPVMVRRALGNLVTNALAHTPAGGRIAVSVEAADDVAVVRVADTGTGIAPEHLPHVFTRFYRVQDPGNSRHPGAVVPSAGPDPAGGAKIAAEPTRHRPGAGLGLAMVRSIAELHGGSAAIESTPGEGTTVTLRFPGASAPSPGAPPDITAP